MEQAPPALVSFCEQQAFDHQLVWLPQFSDILLATEGLQPFEFRAASVNLTAHDDCKCTSPDAGGRYSSRGYGRSQFAELWYGELVALQCKTPRYWTVQIWSNEVNRSANQQSCRHSDHIEKVISALTGCIMHASPELRHWLL